MEKAMQIEYGLEDKSYMDETQLNYFKNKLIHLKMDLMEKIYNHKVKIKTMKAVSADIIDQSNIMMAVNNEIDSQNRYQQMLRQINAALHRIDDGSFGYCRITGMPIGIKRLKAMPFAALSIEALNQIETRQ
jgi:DnaK suppressor protein